MKLSDTTIRNSKPTKSPYKVADGLGLFLLVTPAGGKLWRLAYRFDGKQQTLALGAYPAVTLAKARERCQAAREQLADGINPSDTRKQIKAADVTRKANTFEVWANCWYEHWKQNVDTNTSKNCAYRLKDRILPALGHLPITDINASHVVAMVKSIANDGALDIAKRSQHIVSQIFRYAIAHAHETGITVNPATQFQPGDIIKHRPVTNMARVEAKDMGELLRRIDLSPAAPTTRLALRLMAYTFVRTSELIEAQWCEFDLNAGLWTIPQARMKMRSPHIVPLAMQAVECLRELQNHTGMVTLLFPNRNDHNRPASNNLLLKALEAMGYKSVMTGHGFRGVASTTLHEQGYQHEHIELQLAHQQRNRVSAAYNHALYLEPRTRMMQSWADWLDRQKRGGEVVQFRVGRHGDAGAPQLKRL